MGSAHAESFDDLPLEQRQIIADNILMTEALLNKMVDQVFSHLLITENLCPLACIGPVTEALSVFDRDQLSMILTQALRRLASARWEAAQ